MTGSAWRRWAFDPLLAYVLLATIVGTILCFVLPQFAGNDEASHFIRAYQVSTGRLVPESAPRGGRASTGACVPQHIAADYQAELFRQFAQGTRSSSGATSARPTRTPTRQEFEAFAKYFKAASPPCGAANSKHYFVDTSTFSWYSPLTYLPSAGAIAIGRAFDWKSVGLDRVGRLAQLAIVVMLTALAIRRMPWGKWIVAMVALTPLGLVIATTIRPDAITTALALVVLASALRAVQRDGFTRRTFIDALLWSALLGLSKPTYWIVAGAFFALLLGLPWRERGVVRTLRDGGWLAIAPVALSAVASTVWQSAQRNQFICDVRFFGVEVDASEATHDLVTQPHRFAGGLVGVVRDHTGAWLRELAQIDPRITGARWPVVTITLILVGFLVLALRPTPPPSPMRSERPHPLLSERVLFGLLALALFTALAAGFAIYCSTPGELNDIFFTARFLLPVVTLALLAVAPPPRLGALLARQPIPPILLLAGFYAWWTVSVVHTVN